MATSARARITLGADDATGPAFASVKARFATLQGEIDSFGSRFAGVAGTMATLFTGFGIGRLVTGVADGLEKLNDLAEATGASVENISRLEDAARRGGAQFEDVAAILVKFNQALNVASPGSEQDDVFRRLGLSVQELRKADPVEALLSTARAFQSFAQDGDNSRAQMLLLGRSIGQLAPVLKDLAEGTQEVGSTTREQVEQAKRFNDQLAVLSANATTAARAVGGPLLQSISDLLDLLNKAASNPGGTLQGLGEKLGTDLLRARLQATTEQLSAGFRQYQEDIALLRRDTGATLGFADAAARVFAEGRVAEYQQLQEAAEAYRAKIDDILYGGGKRRPANEGGGSIVPQQLGPIGQGTAKPAVDLAGKYVDKLREAMLATQDLTAVDRARLEINTGALGVVSEATRQQVLAFAQGLDSLKQIQLFEKGRQQMMAEGLQVFAQTRTEAEKQAIAVQRATELVDAGAISWDTYGRVVTKSLGAALQGLDEQMAKLPKLGKPLQEISVFAEQAARNIQDALGDGMLAVVEGKFNDLGRIFANTIKRMAAQAAAAQLGKALFGDFGSPGGGSLGGLIGGLFVSGTRATGGPVQAGRAYLVGEQGPEIMVPTASGAIVPNHAIGGGGPSFTFAPVVHANGDVSPQTLAAIDARIASWYQRYMRQMNTRAA